MRKTLVFLALGLATAGPALAQSNQGAFGLDAMVAPTTSFGFGYYITDGLSLRPWLGLGYSDYSGFFANTGAQLRYEFMARERFAPYLSATAQYSHYGNSSSLSTFRPGSTAYQTLPGDLGQLGAGAGLRCRVSDSVALFGEGRFMYATAPLGTASYGWSSVSVNDRSHVDAILGLTYLLH